MVQAATRGAIDFKDVRVRDPGWWQKTRILLRQVEVDNYLRHLEAVQHHNLSTLVVPNLKEEVFESAKEGASNVGKLLYEMLFPWERKADEKPTNEIKSMRQAWIDVWGDPDDPEVQKRIQETVASLENSMVKV